MSCMGMMMNCVGSSTGMYSVTSSSATSFNNYPPTRKVLFGLKATF